MGISSKNPETKKLANVKVFLSAPRPELQFKG